MTPQELFAAFREDVRDTMEPYLWTDAEVWRYMNDAQRMFCRRTGGIADSSSGLTMVPYKKDMRYVPYDPKILKIRTIYDGIRRREVEMMNLEVREMCRRSDAKGEISGVIVDTDMHQMQLYPLPVEDGWLELTVWRLPRMTLSAADDSQFEIDEHHVMHLLMWMKHLAYSKHDAETYDKTKAAEFQQAFYHYCDESKRERERREHRPRTVAYGGI